MEKRKPIEARECAVCKKLFVAYFKNEKCCSPECRAIRAKLMSKKREWAKKTEKQQKKNRLAEIEAEARRQGLSYGKYKARKYQMGG